MKINDILKEENAGKVYIITNGEWKGKKVTINEFPTAEITLNGRTDDIGDAVHLADILEVEFEEENPYKEISGREALKILLDGGVIYGDDDFDFFYYIKGDRLVYRGVFKTLQESNMTFSRVLKSKWYIRN